MQSQGQTWRALRVPLVTLGGFLFALALVVLGAFYLWRGPITVHGAPTGRLIERFTAVERYVHWTVAITFTVLGVTGLILTFGKAVLLPLIGYTLFSWLATLAKFLHNFVGPILAVVLPIMIVLFMGENLFRKGDWAWLKRGGGMLTGEHVPSGKANAGQKILFWIMAVGCGLALIVTGLILDFPNFDQTRATMQVANVIHLVAGLIAILSAVRPHLSRLDRHAGSARRHAYGVRRRNLGPRAPRVLVQRGKRGSPGGTAACARGHPA